MGLVRYMYLFWVPQKQCSRVQPAKLTNYRVHTNLEI